MKALFVSRDFSNLLDGGSIVTHRNLTFLKKCVEKVDVLIIPKAKLTTLLRNFLLLESYGNTPKIKRKLKAFLKNNYDFIWFDGSHYGGFEEIVRKEGTPTICFFHNIESDFYKAKANTTKKILDRLFVPYMQYNERKSVKNAHKIITINERDSSRLNEEYGIKANHILHTSFQPINIKDLKDSQDKGIEPYLLFVGSNFYANVEALEYTIINILPYISFKLKVVGTVCDSFIERKDLEFPNNIEFIGKVKSLLPYYANASAVLSPILSGSGTKTKTIEALAYGKKIIGSQEALMGVPSSFYPRIGCLCTSDEDYISAINALDGSKFNQESYNVFNELFSSETEFNKFEKFLKSWISTL